MTHEQPDRDVVLWSGQFCFILSRTSGNISTYVGPKTETLDDNKRLVVFDEHDKEFRIVDRLEQAVQTHVVAPEGWYAVLKNPSVMEDKHPKEGIIYENAKLAVGQKVNIPGHVSFARFPGQMVKVLKGHHLHTNEYLVCRVYNDKAAKESLAQAVLKPQTDEEGEALTPEMAGLNADDMVMGKLLIIKGTEYSFFIPPTGIEVIAEDAEDEWEDDAAASYIRQAVTLEQLEYSVLLDEDGNKEYVYGPAVVFPRPTQKFLTKKSPDGKRTRKFRCIELNPLQGIYGKVIAEYTDDNGVDHEVGEELFITGGEDGQRIFRPRAEIAIIKYGESIKHYAIAIPEGEARYALNRNTGQIRVVEGPTMWLPDPRTEVPIRRVLSPGQVEMLYPGNREAQEYNETLRGMLGGGSDFVTERAFSANNPHGLSRSSGRMSKGIMRGVAYAADSHSLSDAHVDYEQASTEVVGDEFMRSANYTQTPSVTLDTKFEGAVTTSVWNNYAILLVRKTGDRRVVVGPETVLLDYDESPEMLKLSKGKPKGTQPPVQTVFLRVKQNRVSDIIKVQTADLVECEVSVIYQIDFEGDDPTKWFDVENYVKFITDHCRSRLRNAAKKLGVEEFHENYIDIVRDTILGVQEDGKRAGRFFEENASRIYEVDVLEMTIGNQEIASLLVSAQLDAVRGTLELREQRRQLAITKEQEETSREVTELRHNTRLKKMALEASEQVALDRVRDEELERNQAHKQKQLQGKLATEDVQKAITEAALAYRRLDDEFDAMQKQRHLDQQHAALTAETASYVERTNAISSDLIAALQQAVSSGVLSDIASSLGVASYLEGESLYAVLHRTLEGTGLEGYLPGPTKKGGNGHTASSPAAS